MNITRIIDEETARRRIASGERVSCIYDPGMDIYYIDCSDESDIDRFLNATRKDYGKHSFLSDGIRTLENGSKVDLPAGKYIVYGESSFVLLNGIDILENLDKMEW